MSACLLVAGKTLTLATATFTLAWTHSVEQTEWREHWRVDPSGLLLVEARVRGSGAGMEPGPGAKLENGWWVWQPQSASIPRLVLAASGATAGGWRLCHAGGCLDFGAEAGQVIEVAPCD